MTICWILVDAEKVGAKNQCMGLAEALGLEARVIPVRIRLPWRWLPVRWWPRSKRILDAVETIDISLANQPDLVIASGRKSVVPALLFKPKATLVLLQKPSLPYEMFDLIIVPEHDRVKANNIFTILGNTHRVTPQKLTQAKQDFPQLVERVREKKVVTWLIGGPNRAFSFPLTVLDQHLTTMLTLLEQDPTYYFLVSTSRRTPPSIKARLQSLNHSRLLLWDEVSPNPYFAYLALAESFVITADSVAMVSEAASTGKPIHLIHLPGKSKKFKLFYDQLQARNIIRPFEGKLEEWEYIPLNETQRAAQEIHQRLGI